MFEGCVWGCVGRSMFRRRRLMLLGRMREQQRLNTATGLHNRE